MIPLNSLFGLQTGIWKGQKQALVHDMAAVFSAPARPKTYVCLGYNVEFGLFCRNSA